MTRTTYHGFEISSADINNALTAGRKQRSVAFHAMLGSLFGRSRRKSGMSEG